MQASSGPTRYRFNFLKYQSIALIVSISLLVLGVGTYFIKGGFAYHISFTGGVEIRVAFEQPLKVAELRSVMSQGGWKDAIIQEIGTSKNEFFIRISNTGSKNTDSNLEEKIVTTLNKNIQNNKARVNNIEWVGPDVGKDTKWNAIKAVFLSLIILLLYIAIRSEFSFGLGAIVALLHDILMVLIFLLITGEPVSLNILAAVLAVLGYSLNDTIVIFNKIRGNFKKMRDASADDIVNVSINQTLTRTILTSISTFLALMAILLLGGETLRSLSQVMCLGVVMGTYSSIYIASVVMLGIKKKMIAKKTLVSHS